MSIKIIADTKDEFPENLRSQAEEIDGKFQIDGNGLINKNKELLRDLSKINTKIETLEADRDAARAEATEWKGKAKLPASHKIVPDDVAELGEAAKEAGLVKDELPTLKTAKEDLQSKLDSIGEQTLREQAAKSVGKRFENFDDHATAKNLKFSKKTEKDGDKGVDYFVVIGKDAEGKDTETKLVDYVKDKSLPDAEGSNDRRYIGQESGKDGKPPGNIAEAHMRKRYTGISKKD